MALCGAIQRIAVAHRFYGYRRVAVLVQREGCGVGAKQVRHPVKEDNSRPWGVSESGGAWVAGITYAR